VTRMNLILLVLVVACALGVVSSQHHARRLFVDLEAEQAMTKRLGEEWTQLTLEQSTWATNKRIEGLASRSLGMRLPDPTTTVIITPASPAR
jgi:cell division protein FtsL